MGAETPRYRVVPASPGVLAHVEHLDPRGEPCGPLAPERTMNRAGEYAKGIVVCCAACGDGVRVPPAVVAKVEASERAWERTRKADEARGDDLDRLSRAGVDVRALPPPKARRKGVRRQQALPFAAPDAVRAYSVPGREGTPADVEAGLRQTDAIEELGGEP